MNSEDNLQVNFTTNSEIIIFDACDNPDQIKQKLSKLILSKELVEFINSGFRIRYKNEVLQIRSSIPVFLVDCQLEQAQILGEFGEELNVLGIKNKLEYRDCCQSNCFGCQIFGNI